MILWNNESTLTKIVNIGYVFTTSVQTMSTDDNRMPR